MKHAPKRWLYRLHIAYLVVDVAVIVGFIGLQLAQVSAETLQVWGFGSLVIVWAVVHLLCGTLIYPVFCRTYPWLTTVVSQAAIDMLMLAMVATSVGGNSVLRIIWMVAISLSAMLGPVVLLVEVMLTGMLVMFTLLGIFIPESPGPIAEALWFGLMIMTAYGSWWVFQRFYEEPELKPGSDKMSQLLKQTQSQSDLIIQSIADGVVVFDANGKISVINTAAASVSEWTLEEAKGIDVRAVIKLVKEDGTPMADDQDVFGEVLKSSQADSHTLRLLGRNGKSTIVSMIISPIRIPNQQETVGAVAVFRDVTLSREEENRRADFISTASHEMRTPVAAIEGYLALALNDKVSQIDTKAREYLEKAHTSTEHLGHLFQDLLTSAKAEDGRLTSHPVVVELGAYLEQLADSFRFSAEKKGLLTDLIIGSAGTPADSTVGSKVVKPLYYVYADPDRMREVITNIFDNAVKYSDTGKITVGLTGNDSVVQLSVKDTGSGIPAEDLGHLFQKFYRVDNSSTRTVGGTGLGLFICRKIVELYHGRIWVESEMGKGSVFYINLPRLSVQKATEMQAAEAAQSSPLGQTNV